VLIGKEKKERRKEKKAKTKGTKSYRNQGTEIRKEKKVRAR